MYQFVCERNAMQDAGKGTTYTRQNTLDWIGRAYSAPSGTQLVRTGITAPPHEPSHPRSRLYELQSAALRALRVPYRTTFTCKG